MWMVKEALSEGYRTLLSIDRGEWVLLPHCVILNIDRGNTKPEKLGCWTGKNHMTNQFIILDWIVEEDKWDHSRSFRENCPNSSSLTLAIFGGGGFILLTPFSLTV
ncbi:uncharacterized protein [Macaca nemestrina]|uniref:uncharacterized protein isoform X3 n=1 Tax=Macaca nemestrina TaxID=9545 RepID=UPI0039B8F9C9